MLKKIGKFFLIFTFFLFLTNSLFAAIQPSISISLEKRRVMQGAPITVTFAVLADKSPSQIPRWDLSNQGFNTEFEMMIPNHSRSLTYINGVLSEKKESRYSYTYKITSKNLGVHTLTGPTFLIDGKQIHSARFQVEITPVQKNPYYTLRIDKIPSTVYSGERIDFDLLFDFSNSVKNLQFNMDFLDGIDHHLVNREKFTNPQQVMLNEAIVEGEILSTGQVQTLRIPLSLIINVPATINFNDTYAGLRGVPTDPSTGFFGRLEEENIIIPVEKIPHLLTVLPLPQEGRPAHFSGLVGDLKISVEARPTTVKVGDPITITITIDSINDYQFELPLLSTKKEFTENFSIPATRSPGKMNDGNKIFTQTLRPLREGSLIIPSIELNYFNTQTNQHGTMKSAPITLTINESTFIDSNEVIYHSALGKDLAAQYQSSRQFHNLAMDLDSSDLKWGSNEKGRVHAILLLVFAIFLFIIISTLFFFQKMGLFSRLKQKKPGSFDLILQKTHGKLLKNEGEKDFEVLKECRNELIFLEDSDKIEILKRLDQFMFHSSQNQEKSVDYFKELIENRKKTSKSKKSLKQRKLSKSKGTQLLFIAFILSITSLLSCTLETPVKIEEVNLLLTDSQENFETGLELILSNEKSPKAHFQKAYDLWEELVKMGVQDDRIQFNLGNAARFLNNDSLALYHYKMALLIAEDPLYREAVELLLANNGFQIEENSFQKLYNNFSYWNNRSSIWIKLIYFFLLLSLFVVLLFLSSVLKGKGKKPPIILYVLNTLIILSLCFLLFSVFVQSTMAKSGDEGVVVSDAEARFGDSYAYEKAFDHPIYQGQLFKTKEIRQGWIHIELPNGLTCWIPQGSARIIQ